MGPAIKKPIFRPFQINLLIRKGEKIALSARLLKWLLSSGRFIVIVVELVTVGAFVTRYKLDSELSSLKDEINNKVPYVKSLKADENLIRQTQFQLSTIKQSQGQSPDFAQAVARVAQLTPSAIKLTNITLDRTQSFPKTLITISGITPSNLELAVFTKSLQAEPTLSEITLTNISFEGQTVFTITGSLTGKGGRSS